MGKHTASRALLVGAVLAALAGCEGQDPFEFLSNPQNKSGETTSSRAAASSGQAIEAEAPSVFGVTDAGLWDGRPSLGGVWVAYPDVADPERVVIRNKANGSYVIGALFRRERDNPGPRFQVSSDAAEALNILAGQPTEIEVVALRKVVTEASKQAAEEEAAAAAEPAAAEPQAPPPAGVDPSVVAAAAIAEAEGREIDFDSALPQANTAEPVETNVLDSVAPVTSTLEKPYIQIGIFNEAANARRTASQMSDAGLAVETLEQESQGKRFYRVVVGPAPNSDARARALASVKALGFTDAYFVTN